MPEQEESVKDFVTRNLGEEAAAASCAGHGTGTLQG